MEALVLKAKTRMEIATEYGISVRTLFRWLRKANIKVSHGLIDPRHLKMIYDSFGYPKKLKL